LVDLVVEVKTILRLKLKKYEAITRVRQFAASLPQRRSSFDSGLDDVGLMTDEVAVGNFFLRVLLFFPASIIPPLLYTHSVICHDIQS